MPLLIHFYAIEVQEDQHSVVMQIFQKSTSGFAPWAEKFINLESIWMFNSDDMAVLALDKLRKVSMGVDRVESVKVAKAEVRRGKRNVFVAVEALYSIDGDLAPLAEIMDVVEKTLERRNGYVVVNKAHSTGLFSNNGRGLVCELGLERRVFARLHTFGKALGCNSSNYNLSTPLSISRLAPVSFSCYKVPLYPYPSLLTRKSHYKSNTLLQLSNAILSNKLRPPPYLFDFNVIPLSGSD
jgi:hypothetical protein